MFDHIPFECSWPLRLIHQGYKYFSAKTHYLQIEPAILRKAARRIVEHFDSSDCDAIFCPGTGVPVYGYLPATVPVFTYLDATKFSWIETYLGINSLTGRSRQQVDQLDQAGLTHNTTTIFSSDWARDEAIRVYDAEPAHLAVVPFGANLASPPRRADVAQWIQERVNRPLRLLFLGKEWDRKGGEEALALTREIRARGLFATLEIVGCTPELGEDDRAISRIHGFVDPSTVKGRTLFQRLLQESHFLLFLSKAEAYGIALCEAAAFGLPAYASALGGIPTIVRHEKTGWLAHRPFSAQAAATTLVSAWREPGRYQEMAWAAREDFEARLNWTSAGAGLLACVESGLSRR